MILNKESSNKSNIKTPIKVKLGIKAQSDLYGKNKDKAIKMTTVIIIIVKDSIIYSFLP